MPVDQPHVERPHVATNGRPAPDAFLHKLAQLVVQAGAGWNTQVPIQIPDDNGVIQNVVTTPAQLIANLTEAIKDNTEAVDNNSEMAQEALEDAAPTRRKKRR